MIAAPALAENCQLGPPTHRTGAVVWMNLDQVELDAAYDQTFYAPLARLIQKRRAANADAMRARLGQPLRKAYGPTDVEKLDIYRTRKTSNAPIFVFIHGGAWLGGEAKNHLPTGRNLHKCWRALSSSIDFCCDPGSAGGDLRVMAEQVRRAIAWVYKNAKSFDGDANRLYISGFSSGGHLCGVALVTDWQKDFGLPADMVKGGLCMSGMYDMKPVRLSKRSSYVKFTDEMEQAMSSQRHRVSCAHRSSAPTGATRPNSGVRTAALSLR